MSNHKRQRSTHIFKRCYGCTLSSVVGVAVHVQNLLPLHWHDPWQNAFLLGENRGDIKPDKLDTVRLTLNHTFYLHTCYSSFSEHETGAHNSLCPVVTTADYQPPLWHKWIMNAIKYHRHSLSGLAVGFNPLIWMDKLFWSQWTGPAGTETTAIVSSSDSHTDTWYLFWSATEFSDRSPTTI